MLPVNIRTEERLGGDFDLSGGFRREQHFCAAGAGTCSPLSMFVSILGGTMSDEHAGDILNLRTDAKASDMRVREEFALRKMRPLRSSCTLTIALIPVLMASSLSTC